MTLHRFVPQVFFGSASGCLLDEYDPSEASYEGAFVAAFQDYVRRELRWNSDMYYTVTANVRPWDQTGDTQVAQVLRSAMTEQSHLKVLVVCGYYDVATPVPF